jgi:nicotinamidase/pyrazinamidase
MSKTNDCALVIDVQNDFLPLPGSTLKVEGGIEDSERLCDWIDKFPLSAIFTSLDTHHALDISHPAWWKEANGDFVDPFTPISSDDIKNGKYMARIDPVGSLNYVETLEANGEFNHFIWPEHCIIGTPGHNLYARYSDTLRNWSKKNLRWVNYINKGVNPYTEHFGIFRANVVKAEDSNTQVNQSIFTALNTFDRIFLAGQARSHCVVNSLKQLLEIAPNLAPKVHIMEDCMSDVQGLPTDFYVYVQSLYDKAIAQGVKVVRSTDL